RPAFHERVVAVLSPDLVAEMIGDRELQEMSGYPLVTEDGTLVLDRRANVEVAALRIVGGDEEEARGARVVDAGRIHEATGTRRLEGFRQLANLESPDVRRNRHEAVCAEKVGDLLQTRLVRRQKIRLIRGNASRPRGI